MPIVLKQLVAELGLPIENAETDMAQLRFSDGYLLLSDEMDKLNSIAEEQPDWEVVIQAATIVLKTQAKECLALAYLVYALARQYKLPGLQQGLMLLASQLESNWSQLLPPLSKMRARTNALNWLSERTAQFMASQSVEQLSLDFIRSLLQPLEKIDQLLQEHCQEDAVSFAATMRPLKHRLQILQQKRQLETQAAEAKAKQKADAAIAKAQQRKQQQQQQGQEPVQVKSDNLSKLNLLELESLYLSKRLAENIALLKEHPIQAALYWQNRQLSWYGNSEEVIMRAAKQSVGEQQSALAFGLMKASKWTEACVAWERVVCQSPFWLDAQYYLVQCLEQLDESEPCIEEIERGLFSLLRRCPSLLNTRMANGWLCLAGDAQSWVCDHVLKITQRYFDDALMEELFRERYPNLSADGLQALINQTASLKSQLVLRALLAGKLMDQQQDRLAFEFLSAQQEAAERCLPAWPVVAGIYLKTWRQAYEKIPVNQRLKRHEALIEKNGCTEYAQYDSILFDQCEL